MTSLSEEHILESCEKRGIPHHMRPSVVMYLQHGIAGDFLTAVLSNDFVHAWGRADSINSAAMRNWASWLYNECPNSAWGSQAKVEAWALARAKEREAEQQEAAK